MNPIWPTGSGGLNSKWYQIATDTAKVQLCRENDECQYSSLMVPGPGKKKKK